MSSNSRGLLPEPTGVSDSMVDLPPLTSFHLTAARSVICDIRSQPNVCL